MDKKHDNLIKKAITSIGVGLLRKELNITRMGVYRFARDGFPKTEWTEETSYAKIFERLSKRKYKAKDLLEESLIIRLLKKEKI